MLTISVVTICDNTLLHYHWLYLLCYTFFFFILTWKIYWSWGKEGRQPLLSADGPTSPHYFWLSLIGRFTCWRRPGRPWAWARCWGAQVSCEQGGGVQAAEGQDLVNPQQVQQVEVCEGDLVAHDEGLNPPGSGTAGSQDLLMPNSALTYSYSPDL